MERRAIGIEGVVQGVGFRPFVHGLASRLRLSGLVWNEPGGVRIEVEGGVRGLDRFLHDLKAHHPPLAHIESIRWESRPPRGEDRFAIVPSVLDAPASVFISPDTSICEDCLSELTDPADRRYGYPFLNCTHCGPRLTIITGAPYDRSRTTMARFSMCPACRAEYENPADRRFHAQPTCCPDCGPRLRVLDGEGEPICSRNPLVRFVEAIRAGGVGAIKGLGGYHLCCDAGDGAAVGELRRRKHRDEKPLAVMVADMRAARRLCEVSAEERALLESPSRPIVLLRRRRFDRSDGPARAVAPRHPHLGVMLPYTPLHHLLMREWDRDRENRGEGALVMTSGNRSDEPIVYRDRDAVERLRGIADLFLTHDRPIHVRCDDSVMRIVAGRELPVRRSRGYAPRPITLPFELPAHLLAVGGQLKNTFALGRGRHAFLSHHMGDLGDYEAQRAFVRDVALYQDLFEIEPEGIAHDMHPDYASTRYARSRTENQRSKIHGLPVQHHHAHVAACMAEHGLREPVIGVAMDGTGYGMDGAVWGGEFLIADYQEFHRAAHLRYVGMPGGERAIREPWRMALSHLRDAGCAYDPPGRRADDPSPLERRTVRRMLDRGLNTPMTSSVGRLFDAAAAIAGLRNRVRYEGQAAIELEWLASEAKAEPPYPYKLVREWGGAPYGGGLIVDTRELVRAVARDAGVDVPADRIARRFHTTIVEIIVEVCRRIRKETALDAVALTGGVFMNALLTREADQRLRETGFRVYRHHLVPPNDGGLSLGQLAVAGARWGGGKSTTRGITNHAATTRPLREAGV